MVETEGTFRGLSFCLPLVGQTSTEPGQKMGNAQYLAIATPEQSSLHLELLFRDGTKQQNNWVQ